MNRKLSPAEMGARDGARLLANKGPFRLEQRCAVAAESGRHHMRHMGAKRLAPADVAEYCTAFLQAALL